MVLPQPRTKLNDSCGRVLERLAHFNFNFPRGSDFLLFAKAALPRPLTAGVSTVSQEAASLGLAVHVHLVL